MFRIKKAQMEFFAEKTREKFARKMAAYIRREQRARVSGMDDEALLGWVRAGVDKANHYRISTEPEVAQLLLLLLVLGARADEEHPWVREVLVDRDLYAIGKVRRIVRRARERGVAGLDEVLVYEQMSDRQTELQTEA